MKKLLKIKLIIGVTAILSTFLVLFIGLVIFASIFSALITSTSHQSNDCKPGKTGQTQYETTSANQTIDSFIKEHEEAYILSWKAGGYLPSFSIAQTYVEYGFNFTNPSGTSFWMAHNMGGVKTGGSIDNFPITLATYGVD